MNAADAIPRLRPAPTGRRSLVRAGVKAGVYFREGFAMVYILCGIGLLGLFALVFGLSPVLGQSAINARADLFTNGASADPVVVAGTVTGASPTITATGSLAGVQIGAVVSGVDVPIGTTVVALDDAAHTATMSANATGGNTGNYTFTPPSGTLVTQGGIFHLIKTDFTPSSTITRASLLLIESTFDGYADKTLSMTLGYIDASGNAYAQSQLLSFIKTVGTADEQVYGWWIDDGTNVIMSGKFNAPVAMTTTGAELSGIFADGYPVGPTWMPLVPANA